MAKAQTSSVVDYSFYLPAPAAGSLYAGASTTDANGNTYIAGTPGSAQGGFFVAKYSAAGIPTFSKTFGNTSFPGFAGYINAIAVDASGNIYLTGSSYCAYGGGLPLTSNAYQSTCGGGFLTVVNAAGTALTYSSYIGGNTTGTGVAVDSSGDVYIGGDVGYTIGTYLPVTPGAPVSNPTGQFESGFLAKFNPNASGASSLVYATFIGAAGSLTASVSGVAVDSAGNAYVTGNDNDALYPTTSGAYAYNGRDQGNDVFVSKVNPTGTAFVYSARLGPGSGSAIALDASNDAYITGTVYEDDYPTTGDAYQTTYPSGFVTELNPSGSALIASTFLGGTRDSYVNGTTSITPTHLALPPGCASKCAVYVAGHTNGSDLPLIDPVQSYIPGSTNSGFFIELAGGLGSAVQSSYFASGSGFDTNEPFVPGIGVDSSRNIYLVGDALPAQLTTTQTTAGPTGEGFFAKIAPTAGAVLAVSPSSITFPQQVVDVSTAQQGLAPETVYLENLGSEAATISSIKLSSTVFSETNNCNGTVAPGGYCTLTLGFTPSAATTQTGTLTVTSNASVNPSLQLAGTAISDRYFVAACGGVAPCPALTYADTTVGNAAAAQMVTLTNLGNTAVPLNSIASNLPDYNLLTNCPLSGTGLGHGQSCEISVQFHPTQVGLRTGTITIASSGTTANTINIAAAGTGLLSPNPSSLVLLDKVLNFGSETLGATTGAMTVTVFNNGNSPATVFLPTTATSGDASGVSDYAVSGNNCGDVLPQTSCTIGIAFSPTATGTRSGTLTIPTSASSTALTSSLTGIGVAQKQELEFTPTAVTFPEQVIDATSSRQSVSVYNVGSSPVSIDRVLVSGNYEISTDQCSQSTLAPAPINEQYASCTVTVVFSPTATGLQTGTLTAIDTEGNQSVLSLAGTGIAQTGSILVSPAGLNFGSLPVGNTSGGQSITFSNIGNSPVTVTSAVPTTDFLFTGLASGGCPAAPYSLSAGQSCSSLAYFSPTKVANPDTGTLNVTTTAGNRSVSLNGVGEVATKAIVLTPPSTAGMNFGSVEVGSSTSTYSYEVSVYNAGTEAVTLSAVPAISGTNNADFSVSSNSCGGANSTLAAGTPCYLYLKFSPSAAGARSAVLTITDDASTGSGVQTIALTGEGTSTAPSYTIVPKELVFGPHTEATTPVLANVTFTNNAATPVTISTVAFSPATNFTQNNYCTGTTVAANGGSCTLSVSFLPIATGALSSTLTLTDSKGNKYTSQIYGYGTPQVDYLFVNPVGLTFAPQPQLSTSGSEQFLIYNRGTITANIGQATGKNTIVGSSTSGAFKVTSDGCSNQGLSDNGYPCGISVALAPTASTSVGAQTGSITVPVTYGDKTTGSYTVSLSGTVVAPSNAAELSPTVLNFLDQAVNTSSAGQYIYLTNNSNLPLTVGALTSTNTAASGPFILMSGSNCSGATLNAGSNCYEEVSFAPTTAASGVKGTLTFPVTYTNGAKATFTATYSGNALAAKFSLDVTPSSGNFGTAVVGETGNLVAFQVTNNGNQSVAFGPSSLTSTQSGTNFTRSNFDYNSCSNATLSVGYSCTFNIYFTPATTSSGTVNGTLTIDDPAATGGPHKIPLVGTALAAGQALTVSQTTIGYGNQPVGTSSATQALYVTNQSSSPVSSVSYALGGMDASDFALQTNTCRSTLWSNYGTQTCALLVSFSPAKASLGSRTATVTVTYTLPGNTTASTLTIHLTGTGVAPAPAVTLFPASISYPQQAVGLRSSAQYFSVYNTGSATLSISALVSTTPDFSIASNSCTSKPLTIGAGQSCLIGVTFAPSASGTRTGSIQFTDNSASGSTQTLPISGTGANIPVASFSPTALAFGNENVGTKSASQTFTLTNPGVVALDIASIVFGGSDPKDFVESTTCGATLASKATCTVTVTFAPTAAGNRTATIVFTDNAKGVSGSTQTIPLTGTGVAATNAAASWPASNSDQAGSGLKRKL